MVPCFQHRLGRRHAGRASAAGRRTGRNRKLDPGVVNQAGLPTWRFERSIVYLTSTYVVATIQKRIKATIFPKHGRISGMRSVFRVRAPV